MVSITPPASAPSSGSHHSDYMPFVESVPVRLTTDGYDSVHANVTVSDFD